MNLDDLDKEQQIMVVMRKILTSVIREITPQPGQPYPLSEPLVKDMRMCLGLISAREQELLAAKGIENPDRPYFSDEPPATKTVPFPEIRKSE